MHQFYKVTLAKRVHIVKTIHYSRLKNCYFHYLISHTVNYFFRDWLIDFCELCYFITVSAAIFYQCSFPLYTVQISTVSTKAIRPQHLRKKKRKKKKKKKLTETQNLFNGLFGLTTDPMPIQAHIIQKACLPAIKTEIGYFVRLITEIGHDNASQMGR